MVVITMGNFMRENVNPKGNRVGDCVVRALAKATDKTWDDVFRELCEIAFEQKQMPNAEAVWKEYAKANGFVYRPLPKVQSGEKRPRVAKFVEGLGEGTYLLRVSKHLAMAKDGRYYDSWDCGNRSLYGYWELHPKGQSGFREKR